MYILQCVPQGGVRCVRKEVEVSYLYVSPMARPFKCVESLNYQNDNHKNYFILPPPRIESNEMNVLWILLKRHNRKNSNMSPGLCVSKNPSKWLCRPTAIIRRSLDPLFRCERAPNTWTMFQFIWVSHAMDRIHHVRYGRKDNRQELSFALYTRSPFCLTLSVFDCMGSSFLESLMHIHLELYMYIKVFVWHSSDNVRTPQ